MTSAATSPGRAGLGHHVLAITGAAMVAAFFLPWIDLLGETLTGFELARDAALGGKRHLLWLCPLGGAAVALAAVSRASSLRALALVVGGGVVGFVAWQVGGGLIRSLHHGAWMTILGASAAIATAAARGGRGWTALAGAVAVLGFFLPWLGSHGVTVTGLDLARLPAAPAELGLPSPAWLYLVPVAAAVAALSALSPRTHAGAIAGGAIVLAVLAYLYLRVYSFFLGWGAWLTLAAAAALLLGGLALLATRAPATR